MKTFEKFLEALAKRESNGNYQAFNCYGYAGKYQMGEMALVDCGYYQKKSCKYNNDWSGNFLGKDCVNSIKDFLKNPIAQENAIRIYLKKQWRYLKALNVTIFLEQMINGYKITKSGLLAGAHLKGCGAVAEYLKSNGKNIGKDAFGTSIETYIKDFAGYDVSEITL